MDLAEVVLRLLGLGIHEVEAFPFITPPPPRSLIGAIRAIQDDFETILVITHLDELKAAFPVRIEVRKEPVTGSTFEVVGV